MIIKSLFKFSISLATSAAILYWLFQLVNSGVPIAERPSVIDALKSTSLVLVLAYLILYLLTSWVRAHRYRWLIQLSGESKLPSMSQMFLVTGVRNMVVDMLPARFGELGYVVILNRLYAVKLEHCVSSLAISIAFDLAALFVVVLALVGFQTLYIGVQSWALLALFISVVLSVVAMLGLFAITPWFVAYLTKRFSKKHKQSSLLNKALAFLNGFSESTVAVRDAGQTVKLLLVSVVIRALKYLGFYLLFQAVASPSFLTISNLPISHIVGALIGGEFGASMPIPTLMSFGAYEAGGLFVLQLFGGIDQAAAAVTMLCTHIWSQSIEYSIGVVLLVLLFWSKRAKHQV